MRAWTSAAVLACFLVAAKGHAANLVEVRVGSHAEFTRVVLETDAPVRYELSRNAEGELRVRLFATATPRRLGSKSPVLREVVVESDAAGSIARLALKKRGAVDVKEMVLDKPPRIDVFEGAFNEVAGFLTETIVELVRLSSERSADVMNETHSISRRASVSASSCPASLRSGIDRLKQHRRGRR